MQISEKMTPVERKASVSLASIYGLRMLGMFLILPIFAVYATHYEGGDNIQLVGMALGAYPMAQALFQLPYGMASDKFGRKNMIMIGLIMLIIGSIVVAMADNIYMVILGRAIQGAGAVSAAVTALLADLTREEHRTKAMAMIGSTIGVTFAISLVLGPALAQWVGIAGIFWLTAILGALAILVIQFVVPAKWPIIALKLWYFCAACRANGHVYCGAVCHFKNQPSNRESALADLFANFSWLVYFDDSSHYCG
jgi:MFS family permease